MSDTDEKKAIVLGGGASEIEAAEYKDRIAKARGGSGVNALKGSTPLGHVERPSIPVLTKPQGQSTQSAGLVDGGVQPRPAGSPVLSPATEQQLQDAARAAQQQAPAAAGSDEAGQVDKKEEDLFALFDFDGKNEAERILNNKKRRDSIEKRCAPMDFQDLLFKDEVAQKVPVKPVAFELTLRTLRPLESLFVKQFMADEAQKSESYFAEKYTLCQLAMAVVAINDQPFGAPHLSQDGETVVKEVFLQRLKKITKMSAYVVGDIALNYAWFDIRVRKLFLADELGNT